MDIRNLISRVKGGDEEAFCAVVGLYEGRVRGYIARFVANADDVSDLSQETFLAAYQGLGVFDSTKDIGAWLNGIAKNKTLAFLRAEGRRKARESDFASGRILRWRMERLEREDNRWKMRLDVLRECIEKLEEKARQLIRMRYSESTSVNALARTLNTNPSTLRTRLLRLRDVLRDCVRKNSLVPEQKHV